MNRTATRRVAVGNGRRIGPAPWPVVAGDRQKYPFLVRPRPGSSTGATRSGWATRRRAQTDLSTAARAHSHLRQDRDRRDVPTEAMVARIERLMSRPCAASICVCRYSGRCQAYWPPAPRRQGDRARTGPSTPAGRRAMASVNTAPNSDGDFNSRTSVLMCLHAPLAHCVAWLMYNDMGALLAVARLGFREAVVDDVIALDAEGALKDAGRARRRHS